MIRKRDEDAAAFAREYLFLALNLGEEMLRSGAEVSRVEDTISRICSTYGSERIDVLTITTSIVVTIYGEAFGTVTQTRRIKEQQYNMHKLELLNQLSRSICQDAPSLEYIKQELKVIERAPRYSFPLQIVTYALISGSFSIFFGGSILDGLASAIIGIIIKFIEPLLRKADINIFFSALLRSAFGGFLAMLFVSAGLGSRVDLISIGNVMLLIPGVALTNSIRDMFDGDTITGLLKFAEAILLSMTIAFGFTLVNFFF